MRTLKDILYELNGIQEFLATSKPQADISQMTAEMQTMRVYLASTAALVADAERLYNKAKREAYYALEARYKEADKKFTPSLAKDFISCSVPDETYAYTWAQRLNAALTHSIEALRTLISTEKQMLTNLR